MTLQSLSRAEDIAELTRPYGLVVVDECHHVPAVAFQQAVQQIPARRWLGLTATPYRRDQLDELIALQLGPVRHTISPPAFGVLPTANTRADTPEPVLHVHRTDFTYQGPANPSDPGGMAAIYRSLVAAQGRTDQVLADVVDALRRGRNCVVLSQWTDHVQRIAAALRAEGLEPAVLVAGSGPGPANSCSTGSSSNPVAGRSCWWVPARTSAKGSTAPPWTRCFWPRRSPPRAG